MGETILSIVKGSPIKILIVLVAIGLLLVPVVSAGTLYQNRESYSTMSKYSLFTWPVNSESNQYPKNVARPYDLNPTACDSCLTIQFLPTTSPYFLAFTTKIPYKSGKSLI